jgi:hypothetical protein
MIIRGDGMRYRYAILPLFAAAVLLATCVLSATAAGTDAGGDYGWYVLRCNINGASVYFDGKYLGTIEQGSFSVATSTTGTPYTTYRVEKSGYATFLGSIPRVPSKGETVDLYATLNPLPPATPAPAGGDKGWFIVHCNVDGATVLFDGDRKGQTTQGKLYVEVFTTATPYLTFRVEKDGYASYTGSVPRMPQKEESIDLYATLNPVAAPVVVTPQSIGGDKGWFVVHCNVDGATVLFDGVEKGTTAQGVLSVQVYVTGTPYRFFTVRKDGYTTYNGSITTTPAKGQMVDLYATLNPQPSTLPTPSPTRAPLPFGIAVIAIVIVGIKSSGSGRKLS